MTRNKLAVLLFSIWAVMLVLSPAILTAQAQQEQSTAVFHVA